MARLILEEAGTRRAFKIGEGRLTIGSGQGCALRLGSPDVADVHAELEVSGGFAFLRPRPGVMPPLMHGQPVTHQMPLPDGARFEIGAARFQYLGNDTGPPPAAGAAAPVTAPTPRVEKRASAPARGPARAKAGAPARPPAGPASAGAAPAGEVQRTRPRTVIKRGIPTWLLLVLIGGGLVIAVFAVRGLVQRAGDSTVVISATLDRAQARFEAREFDAARSALALIPRERATPDELKRMDSILRQMEDIDRGLELDREHGREAENYRQTQLVNFQRRYMAGDNPPRERVRVFLKRLQEFRRRWPAYPEMDWIDRQERLYSRLASLADPPNYTDIAYEVLTLTWAKPRHYRQAADLVRSFAEGASGSEREQALALLDELAQGEKEFFDDQMLQAKYHWERKESGKSVGVLISLILYLDDPGHVDQAARELVNLPGFDEFLRGFRRESSERYDQLIQQPRVREAARKVGLL